MAVLRWIAGAVLAGVDIPKSMGERELPLN
jgi:hypothetical protein